MRMPVAASSSQCSSCDGCESSNVYDTAAAKPAHGSTRRFASAPLGGSTSPGPGGTGKSGALVPPVPLVPPVAEPPVAEPPVSEPLAPPVAEPDAPPVEVPDAPSLESSESEPSSPHA